MTYVSLKKCIVGRNTPNTSAQWGPPHLHLWCIHHSHINKSNSSTKGGPAWNVPPSVKQTFYPATVSLAHPHTYEMKVKSPGQTIHKSFSSVLLSLVLNWNHVINAWMFQPEAQREMKPPVLGPKLISFFYPVLLCLRFRSNFSVLLRLCWFHFIFQASGGFNSKSSWRPLCLTLCFCCCSH